MDVPVPEAPAAPAPIHYPLNNGEIRLVTLAPGKFDDDIECSLSMHLLERDPTYEALSWYWGTPNPDTDPTIYICGQKFSVPANLERVLRYLRAEDKSRILWIDALCIDQKNILERNHQVELMGTIYHTADEVVIWLGEPKAQNGDILALVLVILWSAIPLDSARQVPDEFLDKDADHFNAAAWSELTIALQNPWWHRMWVYQEYVLAKAVSFMFGHAIISELELGGATFKWYKVLDKPQILSNRITASQITLLLYSLLIANFMRLLQHRCCRMSDSPERLPFKKLDLMELQHITHLSESSDPRDKIYALRGVDEVGDIVITVDYTKTVGAVYIDFAARCIEARQSLEILTYSGIGCALLSRTDALDTPSWVPDFRASAFQRGHCYQGMTEADNRETASCNLHADGRYLHCTGILYDILTAATALNIRDCFETDSPTSSASNSSLRDQCPPASYPTGVSRIEAFFRTTVSDVGLVGVPLQCDHCSFVDSAFGFMYLYGTQALGGLFDDSRNIDSILHSFEPDGEIRSYAICFNSWVDKLCSLVPEPKPSCDEFHALEDPQNTRRSNRTKIPWPASYTLHDLDDPTGWAHILQYARQVAGRTDNLSSSPPQRATWVSAHSMLEKEISSALSLAARCP